jgi:hypothetical protein
MKGLKTLITSIEILYIFPGFSRIQLKKIKYVVDRGILWKLEVALCQEKSAQACSRIMFDYLLSEKNLVGGVRTSRE